ncbi:glyoxylase-like metal-dependent hydrolase (beta-lactamase superfamily II) [Neobacillus bataviensis]|uniref:Glyoxylase-like metal-dependent hydrolase (Beta-lactamase superfamily II) n=1 Tax=Neobacillus bataviensis TaxID=220685 RepID=A0A561DY52_9BACI|nr:glyoxylase-like metal-dependent hydrolase (beta-lactamase superfamily II) [Neobacillus bataviensis]
MNVTGRFNLIIIVAQLTYIILLADRALSGYRREGHLLLEIIPLVLDTDFAEGTVNAFLAIGDTITLIDTGNPGKESFQQLKTKLHKHDVTLRDLDKIVLTHIHIDHAGGIPYIQADTDLPIFVHEQGKGWINSSIDKFEKDQQFFQDFLQSCGADPSKHIVQRHFKEENWRNVSYVKEGDTVLIGGKRFEVIHVPGHSQSDILMWNHETGDSFAGDHLIKAFSVNAFIEPPLLDGESRPKPLLQYRNSLEKVSRLPLNTIYPGHGDHFTNHKELIQTRLQEQEKRCEQILAILADNRKSIFEICQEMYPRLKGKTVFLGLSQIQGHLDLLETRQKVSFNRNGSLVEYFSL